MPRGRTIQKELTTVEMSPSELREHLHKMLGLAIPKLWHMRWNNNFEKFTFATLRSQRVLRINSDFGAVVSVPTQDTENQAVPTRMLQCI